MAPCCSKIDHDPAKSTAATITVSFAFQLFISAISSGRQKAPMYFEIWQTATRLRYNSGFNIFLRCVAVFAAVPDPARSASCATTHSPTLSFPPHPVFQQAGKQGSTAHNTAEHRRATGKKKKKNQTHFSPAVRLSPCKVQYAKSPGVRERPALKASLWYAMESPLAQDR